MNKINELLENIAHKDWGGRSLMQEARLSGGMFQYHAVMLDYPWAKELSFQVVDTTYTLRIARKTPQGAVWVPVCIAELTPSSPVTHNEKIAKILDQILGIPTGIT